MKIRLMTGFLILATVVVWIGWDVYAWLAADDATISVVVTDWSRIAPGIAFLVGVLCGHFFFPAKGTGE